MPTPVPARQPPAGLLHTTHLPRRGTIPLRTALLAFADDMAIVTATARQPLPNALDNIRANKVLHDVTSYLEKNRLLVQNVKSATMVHNAPPRPLSPGDTSITRTDNATYLGIQQAATAEGVTLASNLERQLTHSLVMACIAALSTQAQAYFLQAVPNAAIRFKAYLLQYIHNYLIQG